MRSDEELKALATRGREPVFKASAVNGDGVLETFFGLLDVTWRKLDREHQLGKLLGISEVAWSCYRWPPKAARGSPPTCRLFSRRCLGGNTHRSAQVPT